MADAAATSQQRKWMQRDDKQTADEVFGKTKMVFVLMWVIGALCLIVVAMGFAAGRDESFSDLADRFLVLFLLCSVMGSLLFERFRRKVLEAKVRALERRLQELAGRVGESGSS